MKKILFFLLAALLFAPAAFAKDVAGVTLPDTVQAGGSGLALNGAGLRTKMFFKVYAGALYLRSASTKAAEIIAADEPMAIRLHFLMDVDAKSILDAWNEGFRNSAGDSYAALSEKIAQFNSCFAADSKKGTVYDVVYDPASGVAVSVNGAVKAVIPGADFKKAVFGIWLGDKPADKTLKKGLLGG